jgi:hypothetical protein
MFAENKIKNLQQTKAETQIAFSFVHIYIIFY